MPEGRRVGGRARSELPATEFKVRSLAVMRRVRDTGVAVTVTSHGRPLVRIVAIREDGEPTGRGCMSGTCDLLASEIVAFPPRGSRREAPVAQRDDEQE
jgi:prevent-host-death family protein